MKRALIFAAGLGTRLKPITDTVPKALVEVGGEPLLQRIIMKLKKAGVEEIVINIHHFASQIVDFVKKNGSFGLKISFSDETDLLRETGGGIRHAAPLLGNDSPFIVHNVDIISNLSIESLITFHNSHTLPLGVEPLATLVVSGRDTKRYLLFRRDNSLAGWMNIETGQVRSPFKELVREPSEEAHNSVEEFLKEHDLSRLAFAGIHYISPKIFSLMESWPEKFSVIDFYLSVCNKYPVFAYEAPDLKLIDVGKLSSLEEAEKSYVYLQS